MACARRRPPLYSAPQTLPIEERNLNIEARKLARLCRDAASDKKAEDILVLDVRKVSTVTDYLVVCSGLSEPQLKAIAEETAKRARDNGRYARYHHGLAASRWIVLDYGDVIVHVFHPDMRERYALEQLWGDAKRVK
jgi:ribosome-associated protein